MLRVVHDPPLLDPQTGNIADLSTLVCFFLFLFVLPTHDAYSVRNHNIIYLLGLIYLLGYKISLPEVFWYPITFVFNRFFLENLGTKKPLAS